MKTNLLMTVAAFGVAACQPANAESTVLGTFGHWTVEVNESIAFGQMHCTVANMWTDPTYGFSGMVLFGFDDGSYGLSVAGANWHPENPLSPVTYTLQFGDGALVDIGPGLAIELTDGVWQVINVFDDAADTADFLVPFILTDQVAVVAGGQALMEWSLDGSGDAMIEFGECHKNIQNAVKAPEGDPL